MFVDLFAGGTGVLANEALTELGVPDEFKWIVTISTTLTVRYVGNKYFVFNNKGDIVRMATDDEIAHATISAKGSDKKIGENGTQTNSTTTGQNGKTERVDVENPAPGQRDGNIHYHDSNNNKYYYDIETGTFIGAPPKINKVLTDSWVKNAIEKALKYLGY